MVDREQLAALGLGAKKADVYLALLRLGTATAMEVAKAARVKRPTAYDILGELLDMNLVSIGFRGKRRVFCAAPPVNLKTDMQSRLARLEGILPDLQALYNLRPTSPRVRYYEGVEGVITVSEGILETISREYFYFGSMKEIVDVTGKEYQRDWVRCRIARKIWSNAIRVREKELPDAFLRGGAQNYRRLRFFPKIIPDDMVSLYIHDNKITMTSALGECYGMVIESRELVTLMKSVWSIVWEAAQEP
jgi:sugar-specific transcriptional regulator TrmB